MNVLTATTKTQGQRENDFCFVPEDELVRLGFECERDEDPDDDCGCHRSLIGTLSSKGTTTFKVSEFHGTKEEFDEMIQTSYFRDGWDTGIDNSELLAIAAQYPQGTVLEKRGDIIQPRQVKI